MIDATPTMPVIACQAHIVGITPDPTPTTAFDWLIEIIEPPKRGSCPSAGVFCASHEFARGVVGGTWQPRLVNSEATKHESGSRQPLAEFDSKPRHE